MIFHLCVEIFLTLKMNMHRHNRQLRGEELQGLNLDQLQQLEKMIESGLSRVLETKVLYFYSSNISKNILGVIVLLILVNM